MPHQLISHLKEGDAVQQYFLVRQADRGTTKDGKPFLSLVLGDKSGVIKARVWSDVLAKCPGPFAVGDHVGVQAQVESYKGEPQLKVGYINTVAALRDLGRDLREYDPELLFQATPYDRQTLWQELWELVETQIGPPLGQLVLKILDRYREEFLVCPAALRYHHPYLGGLLEHTWFVARHALASVAIYPELNRDLVLAGAILHDLGKTQCLGTCNNHAELGAGILEELGYIQVAQVVREHVYLDGSIMDPRPLREAEVVNYADKRVLHEEVVTLAARFADLKVRYGRTPEALARIQATEVRTQALEEKLFAPLRLTPLDLLRVNGKRGIGAR